MAELRPIQETTLRLADDLIDGILDGSKRVTLRKGYRDFTENITIAGYPAVVESVKHYTLETCPLEVLQDDGFQDVDDAIQGMMRHYPDITGKSPVTVVRFHLV